MPPGPSCRSWSAVFVLLEAGWCLLFLVGGGVGVGVVVVGGGGGGDSGGGEKSTAVLVPRG